jgi:hypothetical protein
MTAGTNLSEAQVAALMRLIGPETDVQLGGLQQMMDFMSGKPYTSPTLEAGLRRQQGTLDERLLRQLGPGGEVSTPGRAAQAEFGTQSEMLREQARIQNIQPILQMLGLLGPQGRQTAAIGFGEPSSGILRTTGVQERLGEFDARSRMAAALYGPQAQTGMAGMAGLGKLGGFLGSKIDWSKLFGGGGMGGGADAPAGSFLDFGVMD